MQIKPLLYFLFCITYSGSTAVDDAEVLKPHNQPLNFFLPLFEFLMTHPAFFTYFSNHTFQTVYFFNEQEQEEV